MQALRLIIALAVVVAVVIFGVKNMAPVTLNYYRGDVELPFFFALLAAFVPGFICAWLLTIRERFREKGAARRTRARVRELEGEIQEFKEKAAAPAPPEVTAPPAEEPGWGFKEEGAEAEEPPPSP